MIDAVARTLASPVRPHVQGAIERLFRPEPFAVVPGDPGLFGPGSQAWRVHGDASVFIAAIRALLLQAMHPEVVAGVVDHSRYRDDPIGRLRRTADWVASITYAPTAQATDAVDALARVHAPVHGVSHRGRAYNASDPALLAWVHNTLVDSFLTAFRRFGPGIRDDDADAYVREMTRVGERLGAGPLPATSRALHAWVRDHPDLADSPGRHETHRFLQSPPISWELRLPYAAFHQGALAITPKRLRDRGLAAHPLPFAFEGAWGTTLAMRLAMGDSPRLEDARMRLAPAVA